MPRGGAGIFRDLGLSAKGRDVLKRKNRWLARASRAAERTLELCRLQKSSEQRAVERGPKFFGSGTFRGLRCVVTHSLVAALVAALFIFAHHTTTICLRRRDDMRTFRDREIQSRVEYICGEGCKALGDLSNAVQFLERALKDGYRAK